MRARSLATRLFLSAAAWSVVILIVTGVALSSFYRQGVERTFDRRLNLHLRTLIAGVASLDAAGDKGLAALGEPLFELPLSGWYWQVLRLNDADDTTSEARASRSLWDRKLPRMDELGFRLNAAGLRVGYVTGPEDQNLRMIERLVDLGHDGRYLVSVAGEATEVAEETRAFNFYLGGTFLVLMAGLLLTTIFQVRFGLAPLKRISESLAAIRSGTAERLHGDFPLEIAPLARETNALIDANREIVERARTHVGNLAHALKTPLSVIINEASALGGEAVGAKILEQTSIMQDQVGRHLERARIAARLTVVGSVTDIAPVIHAVGRTMEKLHRDRRLAIAINVPADARFRGERQDLEEMIGNLLDNACKWARSMVSVEVAVEASSDATRPPCVRVIVDDDGPGLSPRERDMVARRGRRLDESKPGSGLGLSIVVDLATLYQGELALSSAPSGGLRAQLTLPAA